MKADFYPDALMEMVVVLHYFCVYVSGQRATLLCGGGGTLGFPEASINALSVEQLAAAGGCSQAGFGGSWAAFFASAALHQGCWAPRQPRFW